MAELFTGRVFGRLTVMSHSHAQGGRSYWVCRCSCGNEKTVQRAHLVSGDTLSCGCLRKERMREGAVQKLSKRNTRHGMAHSREYKTWEQMRERCRNPKHKAWKYYGGKGITVCERWQTFENFFADMGARPTGCEIDRINPEQGYNPGNCRWLPRRENGLRALQKGVVA